MIERILIENGLTEREAKIYLTVLELGESTVLQIAKRTQLKRTTVYDVLEKLRSHGVVSVMRRKGSKYASALPPRVLVDRFKRSAEMAEGILPQMIELAYSSPLRPRMRFYEGISGLKDILREVSHASDQTFGFTDYARMPKELLEFIRKEVVPERRRHHNFIRMIVPKNEMNAKMRADDERHYGEHRLLHFPEATDHVEILMFDKTKVAFLSFAQKELFGAVLDSSAIYRTLKNLFQVLWIRTENDSRISKI